MYTELPPEIEACEPDYSIYPECDYALGFLSRGCINKCPWCVVPRKEGNIRRYRDIETVAAGRKKVVLMDNNFLANDDAFVEEQLAKAKQLKVRIDFNQAMDCRLVNEWNAPMLANTKWIRFIRFSCDTMSQFEPLKRAILLLRKCGYGIQKWIMVYVLARSFEDVYERLMKIIELPHETYGYISPFIMRYKNFDTGEEAKDRDLLRLTHWCNRPWYRQACKFEDFTLGR